MDSVISTFFITLFISVVLYYIIPLKYRWVILLLASLGFYIATGLHLLFFVCFTVITTYFCALGLTKLDNAKTESTDPKKLKTKKKAVVASTILVNLGIIAFLKYYNFFGNTLNMIAISAGGTSFMPTLKLFLPIGISFYTLQAIGYIVDVYRGKYPAEVQFGKVALFLMFFPQIMEGPIAKYDQTADQLFEGHRLDYQNITFGLQRILWGLFKKMIVADRLYLLVHTIVESPSQYGGVASLMYILLYTLQLYADFSGFIDMAIGSAEMFGIRLPENFRQPFFAKSAQEFWQRWHISLGVWLKEYVFYSVALSPKVMKVCGAIKKKHKNHFTKSLSTLLALLCVWLVNGIWHGAQWNYIVYGGYYFVIIALGILLAPVFKTLMTKLKINPESKWFNAFRHIRTLLIIFVGEAIFGANSMKDACTILINMFKPWQGSIFSLGLDYKEFIIGILGVIAIFAMDAVKEKKIEVRQCIAAQTLPLRWAIWLGLIFIVIVFGAYGGYYSLVPFIYGGF